MKKKITLLATIALTSLATLTFNNLPAQTPPDASQTTPPASVPPPGAPGVPGTPGGPPGQRPGMPPQFRRGSRSAFQQTAMSLRRAKMELERSTDDFGGHRQSALDACDKAMQELEAVMKAQAATARQTPPAGAPGNPSPLQAPAPPQAPPQ